MTTLAHVVRSLAAGAAVYVLMAACAAEEGAPARVLHSSSSSSSGGGDESAVDAFLDELGDPVKGAAAAPSSSIENCDKSYAIGATNVRYAEHAYPGATAAELASVLILVAEPNGPPGYAQTAGIVPWVKEGSVASPCGNATSLTFIRP
jgi:hypothetical protein